MGSQIRKPLKNTINNKATKKENGNINIINLTSIISDDMRKALNLLDYAILKIEQLNPK